MARAGSALLLLLFTMTLLYVTSTQDLEGCGSSKGCFRQPDGCSGTDCMVYLTWVMLPNGRVQFSMRGTVSGADRWVAFGLKKSEDQVGNSMWPAEVYAFTSNAALTRSANYRGGGGLNTWPLKVPTGTVANESIQVEDGAISGTFTRAPSVENNDDSFFYNISGEHTYKIIMAMGPYLNENGTIVSKMHTSDWGSGDPVNFSAFSQVEDADEGPLEKLHACLMVIAWVGFASIGITMARYFKPMWSNSTLLGQKVWFTIHRTSMIICVLCCITGFVVIFVEHGGFVETGEGRSRSVAHAILGIIVTMLGLLNPVMALFRPHPGTPNRPIFNWAHFGVGIGAYTGAFATVFLGIGRNNRGLIAGIPEYTFYVLVVFVAFLVLIWILFEVQRCMTESRARTDDIPLNNAEDSSQAAVGNQGQPIGSTAKITLLSIFILGVGLVLAFLIIVIIIA